MDKRKEVLLNTLKGKEPALTSAAAEALEKLQIRERLDFLDEKITSGKMLEKIRAIYALSGLKGQTIMALVAKALKDPSPDVRAAAARVLGEMGDSRVLKPMVDALDDTDPNVLRSLVAALGKYSEPRVLGPVMKLLKNKDVGVVEKSLEFVASIGDKRSEEAMIYFAVKGNKHMRAVALQALGVMDS